MSARTRRRSFAAPLVLTFAGACGGKTVPVHDNPPPPRVDKPTEWLVWKRDDKCFAGDSRVCPTPIGTSAEFACPSAKPYPCPEILSLDPPVTIHQTSGDPAVCIIPMDPIECPPEASCNPPPPQTLPCPTE